MDFVNENMHSDLVIEYAECAFITAVSMTGSASGS